jgi:pimeloyl-ACP methyl ester carboxylesterase
MHIVIDELAANYAVSGKGKTLLLLHGWGDSLATFRALQKELGKSFRVVSLDLPGFGGSEPPKTAWGLDEYARFVARFIDKSGIEPDVLIGHSNGGAIIIRGVGSKMLSAERLVLLAASGIRDRYKGRKKVVRLAAKAGRAASRVLPRSQQKRLKRAFYDRIGSDLLVAEHLQETFKKVVEDDVQTDAAKISQPSLLIYGSADKATPVEYGETYVQLMQDARLITIDGAGHFVHHEQSGRILDEIKRFIG